MRWLGGWRGGIPRRDGGGRAAGCESETDAGEVGHGQSIGDALEHLKGCDLRGPVHDGADFALTEADGDTDSGLAHSAVLANQAEYLADIAGA
ncbi:hypothetical protein OG589_02925 [Sphaerisporangium sp. NBC_01403]